MESPKPTNPFEENTTSNQKTVLVTADLEKDIYLSSRNLQKASVARAQDLNTYQVLNANTVILSEGSIEN